MCNIAGYVGTRPAAPILVDMLRRQEGWDCGHYTGMATIHDGQYHMEKVIGDLDMFLERKDLSSLPGTVGIIHSRTPGKGACRVDSWSHPFLGYRGNVVFVVNGCGGVFKSDLLESKGSVYRELKKAGYQFSSAVTPEPDQNASSTDGILIHPSEMNTQLIDKYMWEGDDFVAASARTYLRRASEIVGLGLDLQNPDSIGWVRMNYPMFAGFADHGYYLATTPQAIPEDARHITLLTALSSGRVYRDRIVTKPFAQRKITVAPVTPSVWKACYEAMEAKLAEGEIDHDSLDRLIRPLFPAATCPPESAVNYAIMNELEKAGRLEITKYRVPGSAPGSTAPKLKAKLK